MFPTIVNLCKYFNHVLILVNVEQLRKIETRYHTYGNTFFYYIFRSNGILHKLINDYLPPQLPILTQYHTLPHFETSKLHNFPK